MSITSRSPSASLINPDAAAETTLTIEGDDLAAGLQYGDTAGLKKLLDWLYGLQKFNHGRQDDEGWKVSVGTGSQDLLYKVPEYRSPFSF
jgi:tryptophan aminotransferase